MFGKKGVTLAEILVVLIIISIAAVLAFPNFVTPSEQANAANAQNNLLAIYSAQQNYNNNNNGYCLDSTPPQAACTSVDANRCAGTLASNNTLAAINCNLSLNIQDSAYTYTCTGTTCTATRNGIAANNTLVLSLNQPIQLTGTPSGNPGCNLTSAWCPP